MAEAKEKNIDIKEEKHSEIKEIEKKENSSKEKVKGKNEIELKRKAKPLSLFGTMNRFFDDMTNWFDEFFWRPMKIWDCEPFSLKVFDEDEFFRTPLANITEDDKKYQITAELPGLEKGDLEITINEDTLEIKGERKEEHEEKDEKGYLRKEYSSSSYYRSFKLPENIDEDKIDATFDKGVLKLTMPKKEIEEKEKKKISIK
ncbi:MAG: Hsp20/alpha crystallin family protein [Promethearchaeota archaeon]